jgi:alpha-1,6-mannosyltransferase
VTLTKPHWNQPQAWQTNAALIAIGFGLIRYTQQLLVETDHFVIGDSGCSSASLALYIGAVLILLLRPGGPKTNRFTLPIIFTFAIATRLVVLFPDPFLSTDVYRYAWDGVVQHAHINPYRYVPGDPVLTFLRSPNQDLYDNINRRDYAHTIYPPVAQMLFYVITWINPTVTFMKTAMVLFEGLTLYGLSLMLRRLGLQPEWLLVYAWCPLCIWEFGSSGHLDSVCMAFIMLAFFFRHKQKPLLTGLFLGLAIFTKFYPLVLFPALYQKQSNGRLDWKMPGIIAGLAAASYSVYLSVGRQVFGFLGGYAKEEGMETGTRYFPLEFAQHLPGLHGLSSGAFLAFAAIILLGLVVWTWLTACQPDSTPASFLRPAICLAFAMMLLFSPHYPWYVAWLIPLLVLCPSLTVFTYICTLFYMCTTRWATGTGAPQYYLNEILYSTTAIAAIIELALYRIPATRRWMRQFAPYSFAHAAFAASNTERSS